MDADEDRPLQDAADEELIDEVARYELRHDGLGRELLTAVRDAVWLIAENPAAWQASEYGRDVRRFVWTGSPSRSSTPSWRTRF